MKTAKRKDGPTSLAASFNGAAFVTEQMLNYSVQAKWTDGGALSGELKLQASNDAFAPPAGNEMYQIENPAASWDDVSGSVVTVTGSNVQMYNVTDVSYKAYRIVWTRTAGTGTMTVEHFAKGRI